MDFVMQAVYRQTDNMIVPIGFSTDRGAAVFYVNSQQSADTLRQASRQINMPSSTRRIVFVVSPNQGPPSVPLDDTAIDKLKAWMSNRYDATNHSLNLSSIANDVQLNGQGLYLSLSKKNVVSTLISIIAENIPHLESLDLSHNKIQILPLFDELPKKVPTLKRINLGNNQIGFERDLQSLSKLKIEELCLDGNPLCDKFDNERDYISVIRKRFPQVLKLDGNDLPPPITFEVESTSSLPDSLSSCFGSNEQVKGLVYQFLQQYFSIYDSDDRQPLMEAYHEKVIFSLSVTENAAISGWQPRFQNYYHESRNMRKISDPKKLGRLLKTGSVSVVAFLKNLPRTSHNSASFLVDITHFSTSLLSFTVNGIFTEPDSDANRPYKRAFTRVFVTVPQGSGIVIANEQLTITNTTEKQRIAKDHNNAVSSPGPLTSPQKPAVTGEQEKIVQQFASQSGMNLEWSKNCLEQNGWDYEKAAHNFTDLSSKGQLPPEAFT